MSKVWIILISIVGGVIFLMWLSWAVFGFIYRNSHNPEPKNQNLTFVGKDKGNYAFSKTYQDADGSIIIASDMIKMASPRFEINIMKIASSGKYLWERSFRFARFTPWDFVPGIIRKGRNIQHLNILGITKFNNNYCLLVKRMDGESNSAYILTVNPNGRLIKYIKSDLDLDRETVPLCVLQNKYAFIAYPDWKTKQLNYVMLDLLTGKTDEKAGVGLVLDSLSIYSIAASPSNDTLAFALSNNSGSSVCYTYTVHKEFKEQFRTTPGSEYSLVKYTRGRLFIGTKEDSLLNVYITEKGQNRIFLSDLVPYQTVRVKDILFTNGYILVAADVRKSDKDEYRWDALTRVYSNDGKFIREYLIRGTGIENIICLYPLEKNRFVVIGSSSSMRLNLGFRIFATVFNL